MKHAIPPRLRFVNSSQEEPGGIIRINQIGTVQIYNLSYQELEIRTDYE